MTFIVVVECAIEHQGKILLIKRPQGVHAAGFLAFPGGKVEYSDGHRDILLHAVKREVFEEVGLELLDPIQFLTSSYFIDSYNKPVLDVIFYCKLESSSALVKPSLREVPEHFWLTRDEIEVHNDAPEWLKHYISYIP